MDWSTCHVGQMRQKLTAEEAEAAERAGLVPGINPDLLAPRPLDPMSMAETNLHGDVPGSRYGRPLGPTEQAPSRKRSDDDASDPVADAAATSAREVESRRTGIPTEVLAHREGPGEGASTSGASTSGASARRTTS